MTQRPAIVFCFDGNYASYAAVATYSLGSNAQGPLAIYWVIPPQDLETARRLQEHLQDFAIEVAIVPAGGDRFAAWRVTHHISRGTYLRLLIPELVDEAKVIYLDCDTLVLSDLTALYETDMGDLPIGGVVDPGGAATSKVPRDPDDTYINSGVLLMNLEVLRSDDLLRQSEQIYALHGDTLTWHDQCVVNKYAEGRKVLLDPQWNRQIFAQSMLERTWNQLVAPGNSRILHFVGEVKPWQEWCSPFIAEFWWAYANRVAPPGLRPTRIATVEQALVLAGVLDLNEKFRQASAVKTKIINLLIGHIKAGQPSPG